MQSIHVCILGRHFNFQFISLRWTRPFIGDFFLDSASLALPLFFLFRVGWIWSKQLSLCMCYNWLTDWKKQLKSTFFSNQGVAQKVFQSKNSKLLVAERNFISERGGEWRREMEMTSAPAPILVSDWFDTLKVLEKNHRNKNEIASKARPRTIPSLVIITWKSY